MLEVIDLRELGKYIRGHKKNCYEHIYAAIDRLEPDKALFIADDEVPSTSAALRSAIYNHYRPRHVHVSLLRGEDRDGRQGFWIIKRGGA